MITKCCFCDYSKETPLPKHILEIIANDDIVTEDLLLWFDRMIKSNDSSDRNGVKVHMGRMHKDETYYGIWPELKYSDWEVPLVEKVAQKFEEHHAFNRMAF